jgi:glucose/arabinose dehydrogenase
MCFGSKGGTLTRYVKLLSMGGLLCAAAIVFSACPKENNYAPFRVIPAANFNGMLAMQMIPGEVPYVAIATQDGLIYRANLLNPNEQPTHLLDLRDRIISNHGDEEGLLGLAFAPDFGTSRRFYVNYTAGSPRRNVIARYVASGPISSGSGQVILQINQPYANHNGGAIEFGPDGMLYITSGDGGDGGDPHGNGQNVNTLLGKILRIDVSGPGGYRIPADNPFARGGGAAEIWAWGFRNPWRMSFDKETGQLWAGDVGQRRWEEIDRVFPGANYGWNTLEGDECYNRPSCNRNGLVPPRIVYPHDLGCSVTGGYVYRGNEWPELKGWYVYGDFCSGRVWALNANADTGGAVQLMDTDLAISSFAQDWNGELYLVTFNNAIYKLVRR